METTTLVPIPRHFGIGTMDTETCIWRSTVNNSRLVTTGYASIIIDATLKPHHLYDIWLEMSFVFQGLTKLNLSKTKILPRFFVANQSPWWLERGLEYLFFQHEEKSELKICQLIFYWSHFEQKLEWKYF